MTFENTGFEGSGSGSFTGWDTTGDTTIQSTFQGTSPTAGSYQALITNGCPDTVETLCKNSTTNNPRNDDPSRGDGIFNFSGNDQISADTGTPDLQSFFGLGANDLSIARENSLISGLRTPKEGSGIKQDIQIVISAADVSSGMNAFTLSFNYAYVTNDGNNTVPGLGDQDFAFFTLGLYNSGTDTYTPTLNSGDPIEVLADSGSTLTDPSSDNFVYQDPTYHTTSNQFSYTVSGLAAGTYEYRLGYGVVDVDNTGRTSGLMLDNFQIVQDVPFDFSPGLGLVLVFILIVADRIRVSRKTKSLKDVN